MTDLRSMARALGGEVSGRSVLCPGPGHSAGDRSLSVMFSPSAPGGFVVWSHAGDDPLAAKDYVRQRLGLQSTQLAPIERRTSPHLAAKLKAPQSGERENKPGQVAHVFRQVCGNPRADHSFPETADRTALALRIWEEARTPIASPVERYLARRGLDLPDDLREVIRFHPSCPFAGTKARAMVALVRDIVTNEPVAIHRTALDLAGNKIAVNGRDRMALGPIGGGGVKLTADETVTTCLGIGEGIETTLSLQSLSEFGTTPVWALLNAGGIAALPVLSGIECLWVAVDNDPAGLAAAECGAQRWRCAGREVFLVKAVAARADLNDLVGVRHG